VNKHRGGVTGLPGFWPWAWLTAFRFGWKQERGLLDAAGWAAKVMLVIFATILVPVLIFATVNVYKHSKETGAYNRYLSCLAKNYPITDGATHYPSASETPLCPATGFH
jgi:hypothetical protein